MKSIYIDGFIADTLKKIKFGREVEIGNLIVADSTPTPYICIAADNQDIDYVTYAARSKVKMLIYLFDKTYSTLLTMTEQVVNALQGLKGNYEGVNVDDCVLRNVVKDWANDVYGIVLTFDIDVFEEMNI